MCKTIIVKTEVVAQKEWIEQIMTEYPTLKFDSTMFYETPSNVGQNFHLEIDNINEHCLCTLTTEEKLLIFNFIEEISQWNL